MTLPAASAALSNFGSMAGDSLGNPAAQGARRRQTRSAEIVFCPGTLPSFQPFTPSTSAVTWHKGWTRREALPPAPCTMPKPRVYRLRRIPLVLGVSSATTPIAKRVSSSSPTGTTIASQAGSSTVTRLATEAG